MLILTARCDYGIEIGSMRLYFSGIGGAGLGPLAHLALDAGYEVTGSDIAEGLFIEELRGRGVDVFIGEQSVAEITKNYEQTPFDWLVVTSALPSTHPHIVFAAQKGIRVSKRHEVINEIIEAKQLKLISIAGTHGKTTTTAMMVWTFKELGVPVSYSIGSNISFGRAAEYNEGSEYFIYEADEFDRNFLHFASYGAIIPSLSYDHPDTYTTQDEYYKAFADFIAQTAQTVVCWKPDYHKLINFLPMKSFVSKPKPFIADADETDPSTATMIGQIKLVGEHNRRNAFLVVTMLLGITEFDIDEIIEAVGRFVGTQRRFETIKENLISDYAHHPDEIAATLQMGREYMTKHNITGKLIAVYQPHQNIRQHEQSVQEGYATCFAQADKVYWLPTYLSRENDLEVLTPEFLSSLVQDAETEVVQLDDQLGEQLIKHTQEGDLILAMGAGSIDSWLRER